MARGFALPPKRVNFTSIKPNVWLWCVVPPLAAALSDTRAVGPGEGRERLTRLGSSRIALQTAVALGLAGCGQTSAGLLHSGDPKICSAPDVRSAIKTLIAIEDTGDDEPYRTNFNKARDRLLLSYEDTTLDGFDKDAQVASCSTAVSGKVDGFQISFDKRLTYTVQPSADSGPVVVKLDRTGFYNVVGDTIDHVITAPPAPSH